MRNATQNVQKEQKAQKQNKDALDSLIGDELGKHHINNCMNDPFYTEDPNTCTSSILSNRHLKYHWKGMSADERNQIRLDQQRQMEDKKKREDMEKEEEKMWAAQEEANRKNLLRVQRLHDKEKSSRIKDEVIEYNRLKAKECDRRDKIMYDSVHSYKP